MAKPYPILPASVLDDLHSLNCTLSAYQLMVESAIRRFCSSDTPSDFETFLMGLDNLFQPILEGYQSIESQAQSFRDMGVVGVCALDPDLADSD